MPKKQQKEPFLHIQQTGIKSPVGHMQEIYISRIGEKEEKEQTKRFNEQHDENGAADKNKAIHSEPKEEQEKKTVGKAKDVMEEKNDEEKKDSLSPYSANQERKPSPSFQRLKSFKEMGILERINYLVDFPKQIAPVSCIFDTEEKTVRGILVGKSDDTIEIRKHDGNIISINITSLKDIKMIGLKR